MLSVHVLLIKNAIVCMHFFTPMKNVIVYLLCYEVYFTSVPLVILVLLIFL